MWAAGAALLAEAPQSCPGTPAIPLGPTRGRMQGLMEEVSKVMICKCQVCMSVKGIRRLKAKHLYTTRPASRAVHGVGSRGAYTMSRMGDEGWDARHSIGADLSCSGQGGRGKRPKRLLYYRTWGLRALPCQITTPRYVPVSSLLLCSTWITSEPKREPPVRRRRS